MASELVVSAERQVLALVVTGLVAWITAKWQSARQVQRTVGAGMTTLGATLESVRTALDKRLDEMERAAAAERERTKAAHELGAAALNLRLQPLERAVFGGQEGGDGLARKLERVVETAAQDRMILLALQQQLGTLASNVQALREDLRTAPRGAPAHPTE